MYKSIPTQRDFHRTTRFFQLSQETQVVTVALTASPDPEKQGEEARVCWGGSWFPVK